MTGISPIGWADAAGASRGTNRSMTSPPFVRRFSKNRLDGEALPAPASAFGVGVVEHEAGGEIILAPVHHRPDQIEYRGAVNVEVAAGGLDLLVEGLFVDDVIDRISEAGAAAPRCR